MRKIFLLTLMAIGIATSALATEKSTEAQQLLDYMNSIYGEKLLTATTACPAWDINEAR